MYNRYLPNAQPFQAPEPEPEHSQGGGVEKLLAQLRGALKGLPLEKLDSGDLLLILVVLLLWREEKDSDLLLALGAAFLMGRDT